MKIKVNYDLLEKVGLGKRGFSLKQCYMGTFIWDSFFTAQEYLSGESLGYSIAYFVGYFAFTSTLSIVSCTLFWGKDEVKNSHLAMLQKDLKSIDVCTSRENLLESYKYKTEYKVGRYKSFVPYLIEKKYIMVPLNEECEESVLQEHIIGTNDYEFSKDEPKKEYKLSFRVAASRV